MPATTLRKDLSLEMHGPTVSGEALVWGEAAASEYIFLHTAWLLQSPSEWLWPFRSLWQWP